MDTLSTLTAVESTALEVSYLRWKAASVLQLPDGSPLYDGSFDQLLVSRLLPSPLLEEKLKQHGNITESDAHKGLVYWMGVRTYVIDQEAMEATGKLGIRQVVILGAGLDLRPWRLKWPQGCTIYEVDTGKADAVKSQVMAGQTSTSHPVNRTFVNADVTQPVVMLEALLACGFDRGQPALWILEGLVGYISAAEMVRLSEGLLAASAGGSRLVVTCPPTPSAREDMLSKGLKLHHTTYEEPEDTLDRFRNTGWTAELMKLEDKVPQVDHQRQWRIIVGTKPPAAES